MSWLFELHKAQPIAHAVGVLAFVCVVGMALGSLKFRGIGLGTAGVLFAGILVGHFGEAVDHHTLDFWKEFRLILTISRVRHGDETHAATATVYPLTTLLRILSAQVLAIVLFR